MSAAPAIACTLPMAAAAAETALPMARPRPVDGFAFYRKHTAALLRRYLRVSMEIGRTPCVLGNLVFRGRVSSYRLRTFEDNIIFVLDVEKCLKRLDDILQEVLTHVVLEDYTFLETAAMTGESLRSIARMHAEALDRLTRHFVQQGLLKLHEEELSREERRN